MADTLERKVGPAAARQLVDSLLWIQRKLSADRIVDWDEAIERTNLSSRTIKRLMRAGEFPPRVSLSPCRSGWRNSDLEAWIASRPQVEQGVRR